MYILKRKANSNPAGSGCCLRRRENYRQRGLTRRSGAVGVYGYVDKTGTMVIGPYVLDDWGIKLKETSEGLAPVVVNGKWGYASRD